MFTSTHVYRQHHLEHHRFVNDAARDPDLVRLRATGHELDFPLPVVAALRFVARQLLLVPLVRYMLVRARLDALGTAGHEVAGAAGVATGPGARGSRLATRIALVQVALAALLCAAAPWGTTPARVALPALALWTAGALVLARLPARRYRAARYPSTLAPALATILRTLHLTPLAVGLALAERAGPRPVVGWFLLLWVLPLFTTFPLFLVLRELVQHGNADRGWASNSRVLLVGPLVRYAVFPFGMDYHLPHHMFASVPHYRLRELHAVLARHPAYAAGRVVEGYALPARRRSARPPTALEALAARRS
jgi:fatty acid desaturase